MERYKKIAVSGTTRPKFQEEDPRFKFGTQLEKLKEIKYRYSKRYNTVF